MLAYITPNSSHTGIHNSQLIPYWHKYNFQLIYWHKYNSQLIQYWHKHNSQLIPYWLQAHTTPNSSHINICNSQLTPYWHTQLSTNSILTLNIHTKQHIHFYHYQEPVLWVCLTYMSSTGCICWLIPLTIQLNSLRYRAFAKASRQSHACPTVRSLRICSPAIYIVKLLVQTVHKILYF